MPELLRVPDLAGHTAGRGSVPSYPAVEAAVRALARVVEYAAWLQRAGMECCGGVARLAKDGAANQLALFHPVEGGAKRFDLFSVLRPITGALRIDGALVVGLRFFSERGELR